MSFYLIWNSLILALTSRFFSKQKIANLNESRKKVERAAKWQSKITEKALSFTDCVLIVCSNTLKIPKIATYDSQIIDRIKKIRKNSFD